MHPVEVIVGQRVDFSFGIRKVHLKCLGCFTRHYQRQYCLVRPYFGNVLNLELYRTGYQHVFFLKKNTHPTLEQTSSLSTLCHLLDQS